MALSAVVAAPRGAVTARVDALDGLRGWLAVVVATSHAVGVLAPDANRLSSLLAADFAVRIFFVHSGFVLALKYFRSHDRRWPEVMLIRRPWRLALPVLAAALVGWALMSICHPLPNRIAALSGFEMEFSRRILTPASVLRQGLIDPLLLGRSIIPGAWWTMPVELYCSLALLAVLVLWGSMPRVVRRTIVTLYVLLVSVVVLSRRAAPVLVFQSLDGAVRLMVILSVAFVFGALLARLSASETRPIERFGSEHRLLAVAGTVLALLVGVAPSILLPVVFQNHSVLQILHLGCAALVVAAVLAWSTPKRLLQAPISSWLGRISFAVYLIHIVVQQTVMAQILVGLEDLGLSRPLSSLIALVVSFVVVFALAQVLTMTADRAAIGFGKPYLYRRFGLGAGGTPVPPPAGSPELPLNGVTASLPAES
ncbi:MAG: acyltransferase family protein [Acidimicrobiia bacterium]|nr:acyltransferase family protein [Acidimicrobiia bacterium]